MYTSRLRFASLAAVTVLVIIAPAARGQGKAEPTYKEVTAQIRVAREIPVIMPTQKETLQDFQFFRYNQASLVKTRAVLGPASRDPQVAKIWSKITPEERIEKLENDLKVNADYPGSELFDISIALPDPAESATIVNAVVKAYLEIAVEEDHRMRIQRLERLKKLYDRYQEELRTKRASLRTLSNSVGQESRHRLNVKESLLQQDLRENHQELRRVLRNQTALLEAHLTKAKADKILTLDKIHEIERAIGEQKLQEDVLKAEEERGLTEVEKLNVKTIDLVSEQEDIAILTETARKIGLEVEKLDVELQAPRRITVWTPAVPGSLKK